MEAVRLFDFENGRLIPSEHCYSLKSLKEAMDFYSKDKQYMKIYLYFFYMYCMDKTMNPCCNLNIREKEEFIAHEVQIDFSLEDDLVIAAGECIKKIYETEMSRFYYAIKTAADNAAEALKQDFTFGRDGNSTALLQIIKSYNDLREAHKNAYNDLQEAQKSVRGEQRLAYDHKKK